MDNHKYTVLFVCIHNSGRNQMAEAFLNKLGKEKFEVESAGTEPGSLKPNVVAAMAESRIDTSSKQTKATFGLVKRGKQYDVVITLCDAASAEKKSCISRQNQAHSLVIF